MDYRTPLRDMRFLINDVLDFEGHYEAIESDASGELVDTVLEQCARFAENELFPLRASGDKTGCSWNEGVVSPPAGFAEAYGITTTFSTEGSSLRIPEIRSRESNVFPL